MAGLKLQLLLGAVLLAASTLAGAQNCRCAKGLCCSQYGHCGTGAPHCGDGCQSGPCYNSPPSGGGVPVEDVVTQRFFDGIIDQAGASCEGKGFHTRKAFLEAAILSSGFGEAVTADHSKREIAAFFAHATHETGYGVPVEDLVTQEFFDSIIDQAGASCEGKGFYYREAFLDAAIQYSDFGTAATADDSKREIAAFFAHVTYETKYFCYIEDPNKIDSNYCDDMEFPQYPCMPGKKYYGRGPLQLSWNYNYGAAGQAIGFDGLNMPELVSMDVVISFKTALWYWMNKVHGVVSEGFGATIRAINGDLECEGGNTPAVNHRVRLYIDYCNRFDVSHGDNLTC